MSVLTETRDEADWLRWRLAGITATDVADATNGTYGGAYAVVARKRGLIDPEPENDQMRRGTRWQPSIADAVHALTGWHVVGEETWCQHVDHDTHRATVDGFLAPANEVTVDDLVGVLEVKTRGVGTRPNRDRWVDQVQWQLHVVQLPFAILAEATIDDTDDTCTGVRISLIEADPARQALLVDIAEELWRHVTEGTLPDPDSATALDAVKAVHATADTDAQPVDLTDLAEDVFRFAAIKAAVEEVTDEHDALEARIRDRIGDALVGECSGYRVRVSAPSKVLTREAEAELLAAHPELGKVVLDRDLAKEAEPELYEAHRAAVGARRLTIKALED